MHRVRLLLKQIITMIHREGMLKIAAIVIIMVLLGSSGYMLFEENISFYDALWWSIVTMTTVGYGDISPATLGGRIVGITIMVTGIGFLGVLTATIASIFVENRFMENKGMKSTSVKDHFIICGWNFRGEKLLQAFRKDPKSEDAPVVIIADIPDKPVDDPLVFFIHGEVNSENLEKACIEDAQVAVVLSDDRLDAYARDAKSILTTLTIESINTNVYTCVELVDEKNVSHCRRAKADEIIAVGELSTNLLAQAALDHGITRMISELISNQYGEDLYKIALPPTYAGRTFFEIMCELKEKYNILCVGIENKTGKNFIANPDNQHVFSEDEKMIVVAPERPDIF